MNTFIKTLLLLFTAFPFFTMAQVTDIGRGTLEIIEIVEDVVMKIQDYNHHQLEDGDNIMDEQFTMEFKKMESIYRKVNESLMSGELNDILSIVESVDKIRATINDLAKKHHLPKLDNLTKNPIDVKVIDLFDLGELSVTEHFNLSDLKPLETHRTNQFNLDNYGIETKLNQAVALFNEVDELKKKAAVLDRDLSAKTVREYIVDALGSEILNFGIDDFIFNMIEDKLTTCDGTEQDIFIDAAAAYAKASADLKAAQIDNIDIGAYMTRKAISKTNFDYAKQVFYQCKNSSGDNKKKLEIMKDAVRELIELLLFLYGIDVSAVYEGLTEIVEEPLLIMNDSERLELMEIRNKHITDSMDKSKQAVQLLNEAAKTTAVSSENIGYKEQEIYMNILTTY